MAKNIFGKSRVVDNPYAIYRNSIGDYQILKTYKMAKNETNQYDRWFVYCNGDYGDMYKIDIVMNSRLVKADPEWLDAYVKCETMLSI